MRVKIILILCGVQSLIAGIWVAGLGGGSAIYLAGDQPQDLYETLRAWRVEAEAGYYAGKEGFNVLVNYAENLAKHQGSSTLTRDLHLALLGEYRLIMLNKAGNLQGTLGLGPSLHRLHFYSANEVLKRSPRFNVDTEVAVLWFTSRHLLIRGQASYSFPPLTPFSGSQLSLTLRFNYRS
ncbi:hypothetical protein JXM67_07855 [candidate division WOR-3 bacterium]|nr:hypothetical protein [candidate division WOR-3 bacterium]